VCRSVTATRRADAVADRLSTADERAPAADAADSARALHRRSVVEVDPESDHRHRNAHVSQVRQRCVVCRWQRSSDNMHDCV